VQKPPGIRIWDLPVRLFHWSVACLFLLNYWLLEAGDPPHEWAGYAIAALVLLRCVWGFVGPHNARFASFFPTRKRLRQHWRELRERHFDPATGHNPLGALMILLMLTLLLVTAVSGWMQELDAFWGEDWVQLLHSYSADVLMAAVAIHVAAVLLMSRISGLALVRTMITGRRPAGSTPPTMIGTTSSPNK